MIKNEKGFLLIVAIHLLAIILFIGSAALIITRVDLKVASNHKTHTTVFWIAEAGIQYAKTTFVEPTLVSGNVFTWNSSGLLYPSATGLVTITPDAGDPDIATVVSTANYAGSTSTVEVGVKKALPSFVGALGAITTAGPTEANGEIVIDGRDHELDGTVIPDSGSYGIYSNETFEQSGGSLIGGTDGTDYVPATPAHPGVILENGTDAQVTPDAVVGFSEGILKNIALSGVAGSQYVTDPADLIGPLSGVTYVEISGDNPWWILGESLILDGGTGILIVHNSSTTAKIKNMNEGTFTGLIIADDVVHVHNTIIGALVSLTTLPSEGNVIGNGSGSILYSSAALNGMVFLEEIKITSWKEDM